MRGNAELNQALKTSLAMEEEGRKFYLEAAAKSTNQSGKEVFEALAQDELNHAEAIRKFQDNLKSEHKTPVLEKAMPEHREIKKRLLFGERARNRLRDLSAEADELKAYEAGMKLETDGYNFYKKSSESVSDDNARALFDFLLKEEITHYQILQDTYQYLKNPEDWFNEQEKPIIEG